MTSGSDPPPMSHSSVYYERSSPSHSPHAHYHYPPVLPLQHPPSAHVNPNPRSPTTTHRTDLNRAQSSVSSGASGSTIGSDYKHQMANQSYQCSPQAERGLEEESMMRQSYMDSRSGSGAHRSNHRRTEMIEDNSAVLRYIQQEAEVEEKENDHALWILVWMSFLDPFHCFFSAIFSIFAVFTIIILLPLRLCRRECSPSISLVRMVAPVFRHHLQMIFAKSLDSAHTFEFSPFCLILVHIVSPLLSIGNAIAAWIVAVFWIFAIIMGNPDGTEKRDDGRATVLMLRDWWEKCLLYAIRK